MDAFTNNIAKATGYTFNTTQHSTVLFDTLNLCKQAMDEWKISVHNRIGFPVSNTDNFPIGHGESAQGYSKELYDMAEYLTGDAIGD